MATDRRPPEYSTKCLALIAAVALCAVVAVWWCAVPLAGFVVGLKPDATMDVGDAFAAVSALFSGLAFVGVIGAILLQRNQIMLQAQELRLQREELALQREEMTRNRAELERSATAAEQQLRMLTLSAQLSALTAIGSLKAEAGRLVRQATGHDDSKRPAERIADEIDVARNQIEMRLAELDAFIRTGTSSTPG